MYTINTFFTFREVILNLLKNTHAENFNFLSIFGDESNFDHEPNLDPIKATEGNHLHHYSIYRTQLCYYYLTTQDLSSYYDIKNFDLNSIFVLPRLTSAITPKTGNKSYTHQLNPFTDPPIVQEKEMGKQMFFARYKTTYKPNTTNAYRPAFPNTRKNRNLRKVRNKRDDHIEVEEVCKIRSTYITPRIGLNDKSEWKYIINLADRDPHIKQVIKVDICA